MPLAPVVTQPLQREPAARSVWRSTLIILAGLGIAALAGQALAQQGAQSLEGPVVRGQQVFEDNCAACHLNSGEGLPPVFPALKGSKLVLGEPTPLIDTVLKGRQGMATMPSWQGTLSPREIAAALTYIRQAWGNQAGAISPQQVSERIK